MSSDLEKGLASSQHALGPVQESQQQQLPASPTTPSAPPIASLPTLKDIRADPGALEARRTRSRVLSQSSHAGERALGRKLSRMTSVPSVSPFGAVSAGDEDASGLPPPRDSMEAEHRRVEEDLSPSVGSEKDDAAWEVTWDENDPANPKNWSVAYRWFLTGAGGLLVLNSTFSSSAPSGMTRQMIGYFGYSREVATLLISLFVAGYCVGPLLWGPASEVYGRKPVFLVAFFCYTAFQIGCALAKNTETILISRFLGGLFGACPLTNAGGLISDIWDQDRRGIALAFFSLAPFAGPAIGPIVSGFMNDAGVVWRDLFWVLFGFAGACFVLVLVAIPETYTPKILANKAKRLRKETGESRWYAPLEKADTSMKARVEAILFKPFKMLFFEPMLLATTLYMSFIYGILYLTFNAFAVIYGPTGHNFSTGITGLMFLPLFLGGAIGTATYILFINPRYVKLHHEYSSMSPPQMVPAEARLEMAVIGGPMFVVAIFFLGWTSYPSITYWCPLIATGLLGWSIIYLFLSLFNYIIDTYLFAAASALAANTVCRSLFGAGFPLFATQMFETLNPRIACTVLGAIALLLCPIPFLFIKYGAVLRAKSRFAPTIKR